MLRNHTLALITSQSGETFMRLPGGTWQELTPGFSLWIDIPGAPVKDLREKRAMITGEAAKALEGELERLEKLAGETP